MSQKTVRAIVFQQEAHIMNRPAGRLSPVDRFLSLFTKMGPGEGPSVLWFALYVFLLLCCYYILKTTREVFILTDYDAEIASYAIAAQALLLFFVVPLYGLLFRASEKKYLIRWVTLFFAVNIGIFYLMGSAGMEIGFVYYVFVGIFGVMLIAQFWAFAADCYNVKSGQRLFPVIMIGGSAGAILGAKVPKVLSAMGVEQIEMLLVAGGILLLTLVLGEVARRTIPDSARSSYEESETEPEQDKIGQALGGFALVMRNRYLLMIVALVVLLNWVNSTGEVILKDFVQNWAVAQVESGAAEDVGVLIGGFFSDFFFTVNLIGFLIQAFLVSRIYRRIGVSGALLILPTIAAIGYGLIAFAIAFVPIFSIIRIVKIMENSVDYSVMNTTRQALFLPLSQAEKYEGKTAIDTFFWRLGDMIQAGAFFVGLNYFKMTIVQFAMLNAVLALVWLFVAYKLGKQYRHQVKTNVHNAAPKLTKPLPDLLAAAGGNISHRFDHDAFVDTDPGDIMTFSARLAGGQALPGWISFDSSRRLFRGTLPTGIGDDIEIEVTATDVEGLSASGTFRIVVGDPGAEPA
jgi:AAA family ATP:ADP antiporter